MINLKQGLRVDSLAGLLANFWEVSGAKITQLEAERTTEEGTPVFTVEGQYVAQGWTEWTQGFQFGSAIIQYDATGDSEFLDSGRQATVDQMASHVTHFGVHDHGFNNISTYGALRRLMLEGRLPYNEWELNFYEMALKSSAAVQAYRWSETVDGDGFIFSFNGPHSLFCDTIRSLRSLSLGHILGHELIHENDDRVSLLDRMLQHARSTARYSVYYGEGRDTYDVWGRVAHESIFNVNDGRYRCPGTQQGYSPFSTWTRGLAWIMAGYPEQLEFIATIDDTELELYGGRQEIESMMLKAARASCDFFIENTPVDGIPYWDTGAPGLSQMGDYLNTASDPLNPHEPVDSSAAAIGAQGLLRLGTILNRRGEDGDNYIQAGLVSAASLLSEPYLCADPNHQGLLLHSVYHRPRGWDHMADRDGVPRGEACLWGDYHLRELALYLQRLLDGAPYYTFFSTSSEV
ncbi:MAG: glycosyl hydrolase [Planctomycetota bacterium]|nr:glycosyl hydrolase [Planctomycetota bacterium]